MHRYEQTKIARKINMSKLRNLIDIYEQTYMNRYEQTKIERFNASHLDPLVFLTHLKGGVD